MGGRWGGCRSWHGCALLEAGCAYVSHAVNTGAVRLCESSGERTRRAILGQWLAKYGRLTIAIPSYLRC